MFEEKDGKVEKDRSRVIMILSAVAVIVVIGLIIIVTSFSGRGTAFEVAKPGSPEYDAYAQFVKIGELDKYTGERLNVNYGRLQFLVENIGDKVLTGIELKSAAIGFNNEVLRQRTVLYVPKHRDSLGPNQSMKVELFLEPIPDPAQIMDFTVEVSGLKVDQ